MNKLNIQKRGFALISQLKKIIIKKAVLLKPTTYTVRK